MSKRGGAGWGQASRRRVEAGQLAVEGDDNAEEGQSGSDRMSLRTSRASGHPPYPWIVERSPDFPMRAFRSKTRSFSRAMLRAPDHFPSRSVYCFLPG